MEAKRILEAAALLRFRSIEEALGRWRVEGGRDDDRVVTITRGRIGGELRHLSLVVESIGLDDRGRVELGGEHAGLFVDVTIARVGGDRAELTWQDGVTHNNLVKLRR